MRLGSLSFSAGTADAVSGGRNTLSHRHGNRRSATARNQECLPPAGGDETNKWSVSPYHYQDQGSYRF